MDNKLLCEIIERIERVAGIEALLVFAVAAFNLAVVTRSVWTDKLMPNTRLRSCFFKQCRQIVLAVGETVRKLETVVRLDTFHLNSSAGVPRPQLSQKVRRRISGLLRVCSKEPQARKLINGCVLEQPKFRICYAGSGNNFYIYLHTLSGASHLFVRLRFVSAFWLFSREQPHFTHDTEQTFRAAAIAALPQTMPKLNHAKSRISVAHVTDELQFGFCVLIRVIVRTP